MNVRALLGGIKGTFWMRRERRLDTSLKHTKRAKKRERVGSIHGVCAGRAIYHGSVCALCFTAALRMLINIRGQSHALIEQRNSTQAAWVVPALSFNYSPDIDHFEIPFLSHHSDVIFYNKKKNK